MRCKIARTPLALSAMYNDIQVQRFTKGSVVRGEGVGLAFHEVRKASHGIYLKGFVFDTNTVIITKKKKVQ